MMRVAREQINNSMDRVPNIAQSFDGMLKKNNDNVKREDENKKI